MARANGAGSSSSNTKIRSLLEFMDKGGNPPSSSRQRRPSANSCILTDQNKSYQEAHNPSDILNKFPKNRPTSFSRNRITAQRRDAHPVSTNDMGYDMKTQNKQTEMKSRGDRHPRIHINYLLIKHLLEKDDDEILDQMSDRQFPLDELLNRDEMLVQYDWILNMTKIFEKVISCSLNRDRLANILSKIPTSKYVEGIYRLVRQLDPKTNELNYDLIQRFLRIFNVFMATLPSSAGDLIRIIERIELMLAKTTSNSSIHEEVQELFKEAKERSEEIQNVLPRIQKSDEGNQKKVPNIPNIQPPDDYRQLQVLPAMNEILSGEKVFLRANITDGVYDNAEHYLDVHFRLLREDFIGPLREGMQQYHSGAAKKDFNIRLYKKVHYHCTRLDRRSGLVHDLQFDKTQSSKIAWDNSQRLIYGNLLLLTIDQFQTYTFVTIEDRSKIKTESILTVRSVPNVTASDPTWIDLDERYFQFPITVIETTVYFQAYRPILGALQKIPTDDSFPLSEFLLKLNSDNVHPDYITNNTRYDFTPLLVDPNAEVVSSLRITSNNGRVRNQMFQNRGYRRIQLDIHYKASRPVKNESKQVPVLNTEKWPTSDELHLNPRQREALISALTRKVALIQGPPGTGKTFLGVKIVEMLLYNRSVWCRSDEKTTPIFMVCQTNHALDQLLELIQKRLQLNEGIIRVGNRSQNPAIQAFSLAKAKSAAHSYRSIPHEIIQRKKCATQEKIRKEQALKSLHSLFAEPKSIILSVHTLDYHLIIRREHSNSLRAKYHYKENILSNWLGLTAHHDSSTDIEDDVDASYPAIAENDQCQNNEKNEANEEENEEDEEEARRRQDTEDDEQYFIESNRTNSAVEKHSNLKREEANAEVDEDGWTNVHRKRNIQKIISGIVSQPTTFTDEDVAELPDDLWVLKMNQRYNLYRYWISKYYERLIEQKKHHIEGYDELVNEIAQCQEDEDYFLMKDCIIVAMTTTCAAMRYQLLQRLQSKIVIVEEAAAILEAHIVTSLTRECQHLILIGDHVQLRPTNNLYLLARHYNIDVSLFERLIKNNFPSVRLNIQHRMRPEISNLMKHFYDDLESHPTMITDRPDVRAVGSNLFFIQHNQMESNLTDGASKRNEFEGDYAVALANYFLKQNYEASKITILVMYLGQRQYIAKKMKASQITGIRVSVTDNYQGEENDIIILSLVRSNVQKNIGFLKTHNRVCVALSRARCGMFVIGNIDLFAEVEPKWRDIRKTLIEQKQIGDGLLLSCREHSKEKFIAKTPQCFKQRPEGGCNKPCTARLECGHTCTLMCHNYDPEHRIIVCRKICAEKLQCGHTCRSRCHKTKPENHGPCTFKVNKFITQCGHQILFECGKTPLINDCSTPIETSLSCGHVTELPCSLVSFEEELNRYKCTVKCNAELACGHPCAGTCGTCFNGRLHIPCKQKCDRPKICSHVCKTPCSENCPSCYEPCITKCIHSSCKKRCGEPCVKCTEPCAYKCKHYKCTRRCFEECNRPMCLEACEKILKCGHNCIGYCGEPCPRHCRICDKDVVEEIFFGTEDEPDARFVYLPDCKHLFEGTGLDQYINQFTSSDQGEAVRFPECPKCKTQIRQCLRYMSIINATHLTIEQIKRKIFGAESKEQLTAKKHQLQDNYRALRTELSSAQLRICDQFFSVLDEMALLENNVLILFTNILSYIGKIMKVQKDIKLDSISDKVLSDLNNVLNYILSSDPKRNFSDQQIKDINDELSRIKRVILIEQLKDSISKQTFSTKLTTSELTNFTSMKALVTKIGRFTQRDKQTFDEHYRTIQHRFNIPGLGINEEERIDIVKALNLTKGHWYRCPRGHPYIITECGGANQVSKCPECGEKIGGENHQLLGTNRHFGEMDGSSHAAWSNEANMNLNLLRFE